MKEVKHFFLGEYFICFYLFIFYFLAVPSRIFPPISYWGTGSV